MEACIVVGGIDHTGTHIGRHTSATLLLAAGADAKDVRAHLGHKDAAMTLNVYCRPYDGTRAELAARLDAACEAVHPAPTRTRAVVISVVISVESGTRVARTRRRSVG